ncbi:MAG: tail fiber domain-containing protein [Chitinophagales bacterium]|nr:tail fiber domain-containing protein [Bacteroidota bacterium]MCB9042295.1 tail fiber domain-containing protein [Chitinophagales bacterium]
MKRHVIFSVLSLIMIVLAHELSAQQVYVQNINNLNARSIDVVTQKTNGNSYGAYITNTGTDSYVKNGLYSYTYNDGTGVSYALRSYNNSWGSADAYGGYFTGSYISSVPTGYGIYASATGASNNWAGYFDGKIGISERIIIQNSTANNNMLVLWETGSGVTNTSTNCYSLGNDVSNFKFNVPWPEDYFTFNNGGSSAGTNGTVIRRLQAGSTGTQGTPAIGIGWFPTSVAYNLDVSGVTYCSSGAWTASDRTFKKDINKYENALETLNELQAYTYHFDQSKAPDYNFDAREHIGYMAQDLQKVVPQAVMEDGRGHLAVNYDMLIPVISEAVKELANGKEDVRNETKALKSKVADLENENAKLQNRLDALESSLQKMSSAMQNCCLSEKVDDISTATLNNSGARLEQNAPNPFYNKTIIQYYLPEDTRNANLQIVNIEGKVVKTISLETTGYGTTTINGNDLAAGTYIYSLVINGKISTSKEMILTK